MSEASVESSGVTSKSEPQDLNNSLVNDGSGDTKNSNITDEAGVKTTAISNANGDSKEGEDEEKPDTPGAEDTMASYAVFVMNVPTTATEEDVKKHFETKTTVKNISLIYSPTGTFCGYATVELPDKAAYEGALKLMRTEMNDSRLYVIPHRTLLKPHRDKDDSRPYKILVSNIPLTATEDDVKKHFEKEVPVQNVSFVNAPDGKFCGYATMELPDKEAYESALKMMGSMMDDINLFVVPHKSMINPHRDKDEARPLKILVSKIPKSVSLIEAKRHFYPAGLIRRFIPRAKDAGKAPGKDGMFKSDWAATIKVNTMDTFANILKMDGILIGGKPVKVEPLVLDKKGVFKRLAECCDGDGSAKRQKLSESDEDKEPDNPLKIFIGNVPLTATSEDIMEHMKQAGEIVKCWVPDDSVSRKRLKTAFVIMADEEGKQKALELTGTTLKDSVLRISPWKRPRGRMFAEPEWIEKPNVVIISNIPQKCTEEALRQHFESAGTIESVRFPRDKDLPIAYMELGDKESYEKAIKLSTTFMGEHCISVMETSSDLVPKMWLNLEAQQHKVKGLKKRYRSYMRGRKRGVKSKGVHPPMLTAREIKRREKRLKRKQERRNNPGYAPSYKMNVDRGARKFGPERGMGGYGYSLFSQAWNENNSGMYRKSSKPLGESKRKEIEQVALAALTELEARKSNSNSYFGAPNTSYGSNYSYTNNAYGMGNSYGSSSNAYGSSNNTLGSGSHMYSSNNTYSSSGGYGSSNSYGMNNSSYNRASTYGTGSGFGSSSSYDTRNTSYYYQQK